MKTLRIAHSPPMTTAPTKANTVMPGEPTKPRMAMVMLYAMESVIKICADSLGLMALTVTPPGGAGKSPVDRVRTPTTVG